MVAILQPLNTPFSFIFGTVISVNLVQLAKEEAPSSSNVLGSVISLSNTSPSNALSPINFKLVGSAIVDIAAQPLNALFSMRCNVEGNSTFFKALQFKNAFSPISVIPSGIVISEIIAPANIAFDTFVIPSAKASPSILVSLNNPSNSDNCIVKVKSLKVHPLKEPLSIDTREGGSDEITKDSHPEKATESIFFKVVGKVIVFKFSQL